MSIVDFIAVISFGLTCFGLGYTFGKDNNKPQKQPPRSANQATIFDIQIVNRTNRLSVVLFFYNHIITHLWKCQKILFLLENSHPRELEVVLMDFFFSSSLDGRTQHNSSFTQAPNCEKGILFFILFYEILSDLIHVSILPLTADR